MNEKEKRGSAQGLDIAAQQSVQMIAALAPAFLSLSPILQAAFVIGGSLIQAYGGFRLAEVINDLKEHQEQLDPAVLESDEFKTALLNVIEAHFKEAAAEKRRLYRNYLINFGKGEYVEIDLHSKILAVLNLITFDEISALSDIIETYDKTSFGEDVPARDRKSLTAQDIYMSLNRDPYSAEAYRLADHMRALQSYNLIFTVDAAETQTGATTPGLQVVTDFARTFMRFIEEPD